MASIWKELRYKDSLAPWVKNVIVPAYLNEGQEIPSSNKLVKQIHGDLSSDATN